MAGGAPSVLPLSLLMLVCSAVVTNAKPYWRSGHHSGGHYSPSGAWAGALPSPRLGAEWNPLLHTSHHRYGHGHAHGGHHGGRASAMAGAGGPWAAVTGGRGAWAVSGGGPWAVTSGGRAGPWAVTGDGRRHSLYAMNGFAWPGLRQPQPVVDNRWGHHFGHHWQVVRTPSLGHHGWGIYWAHNGRRDCDHQGRHRPEHQPEEDEDEEQPEEREEESEDDDIPDDFDGSGFFPEVRFDFPRLPEITPSWPDVLPEEPEASGTPEETPEVPEVTPEPPQTTPPQPTQPEKTDCPEGAVFLDGECVCPDSKPFLDTILSRCVDIKPVIH